MKRFLRTPAIIGRLSSFQFSAAEASADQSARAGNLESIKKALAGASRVQKETFEVSDQTLDRDFTTEVEPVLNFLKEEVGLSTTDIAAIMYTKQDLLSGDQGQERGVMNSYKFLQEQIGLTSEEVADVFVSYPVATTADIPKLQRMIDYLREGVGMSQEQIKEAYLKYPRFLHSNLEFAKQIVWTLNWMLSLKPEQTIQWIVDFPVVLSVYPQVVHFQIEHLKEECRFSNELVMKLYKTCPHLIVSDVGNMKAGFDFLKEKGLNISQVQAVALAAPELLRVGLGLLNQKFAFLQKNGVSDQEILNVLTYYPEVFTRSIKSWEMKTKYFEQRLGIDLSDEVTYPLSLNFNYNAIIRPRGEMMLIKETMKPLKEVLMLSNEEFCESIGCTAEELQKKTAERRRTTELDKIWDIEEVYDHFIPDDEDSDDEQECIDE